MSVWMVSATGKDLWNPSQRRGYLFLSGLRSLESDLESSSGVSDIESDEVVVDTLMLEKFVRLAVGRFEDAVFRVQAEGLAALSLVLIRRDRTFLTPTDDLVEHWRISEWLETGMAT